MSYFVDSSKLTGYGGLLLRISLGLILLSHGVLKFLDLPATLGFFASLGLSSHVTIAVAALEVIGGVALLLGFQTRWVSLAILPILIGATWVHAGNGLLFSNAGGGWEFPLLLVAIAVVQGLIGDGAYSISQLVRLLDHREVSHA